MGRDLQFADHVLKVNFGQACDTTVQSYYNLQPTHSSVIIIFVFVIPLLKDNFILSVSHNIHGDLAIGLTMYVCFQNDHGKNLQLLPAAVPTKMVPGSNVTSLS